MANYSPGVATRERIISVCKELFYENGYSETPYGDICKKAQVNNGTVTYHFKGKAKLAQLIYAEMMEKTHIRINEIFPDESDLSIQLLGICIHLKLMFVDEKYRRFNTQFVSDCIDDIIADRFEHFAPIAFNYMEKHVDPDMLDFYITASAGFDIQINSFISKKRDSLDFSKLAYYSCELYLYFLDKEIVKSETKNVLRLIEHLHITNNGFDIEISRV